MKHSEVLKMVDHTLLAQTATWEKIRQICDDGLRYGTASVCIPPCYVAAAAEYVQGKIPICTVIGFPMVITPQKQRSMKPKTPLQTVHPNWTW